YSSHRFAFMQLAISCQSPERSQLSLLSLGDITQKGYEKKRGKLLAPYIPQIQVEESERLNTVFKNSSSTAAVSVYLHTEAVQAALAKYKERKMPMPSKRRSVLVQSSVEACTPPDTSSASEDEGSLRRQGRVASSSPYQSHPTVEHWFNRVIQGSSTSSSASSTSSHPGGRSHNATANNHCAPPDVTGLSERSQVASVRGLTRGYTHTSSTMETADGVPVNSRVSSKIQQLLNTLKRPKRPPLREFFLDDFEELLDVQQPDPNQPKPEGVQMSPLHGEPMGVVTNWPPSLLASLQRWGTTQPKSPCLTALDNVALVFPNNDPVMFMVAFYGCLLAELVPVPIEVPLTRKDAGSQQIGFLLGSCGVTLALTTDACQKGLPKAQTGEVATFKGWPRLLWFVTDGKHVVKPPKDWVPLIRDASNETAYIEYKTSKEGSTMGITVSHAAMLAHCHALTQACGYTDGETITNVLDFKRDAGLWHGVLTSVMNRMHVISIPYSLMKVNPLSWIQKVHTYKGSISSCDAFLNVFQARGLRPEVICPCASSPEAMTVAIRRPPEMGVPPPGKAVLSMSSLSHSVIRVDTEEKLSVLTLQDVGQVMPGAMVCVVRPEGTPYLCRSDEVGEICVSSCTTGISYYGLPGMTKNVFETIPVTASGSPVSDRPFTRTSLLGFIGPDNLLFVVGKMDGLMVVSGRRHNADDVVATALAVEPMKFVYRGRIAVFSVCVLHDERIVVVAEQRPDASEEDSFQWMSRVLQVHTHTHTFLIVLLHSFCRGNRQMTVNEPGCQKEKVFILKLQKKLAMLPGRELSLMEINCVYVVFLLQFLYMQDVLQWRAQATPDHPLFLLLNAKGTVASTASCVQIHKRAERVAMALMERGRLNAGDHVALVYPPGNNNTFYPIKLQSKDETHLKLNSILVPPLELESNVSLWLTAVSQFKVRVTFCSYSVMEMCTKGLGSQTEALRLRNVNLSCVRTCMVVAEERPRIALTQSFSKIFKDLGLSPRAVSTTFGCRVNVAICLQGTAGPDPTTVYVDMRALRHDRYCNPLQILTLILLTLRLFKGILPGVKVIIANTETKGPLGDSHLGEIWVSSPHNATGYYTVYGEEALHADHFCTKLSFGDTQTVWARTGYLGFLRRTELTDASGERHDALYVVGSLDETLELRGMRYHPIDIETSVIRAHKSIAECAVFTWTNLLVVVVELEGSEQEALDLVALVTNVVLEEHFLIVGVVVVVDPGVIPINSRGEKQRMHLRDGFLADQLDPIYVAYNM
uniref:Disco-interacting protein 2 homolog A n=1 Tax=Astyanax mexicanus TaxID=7994 RepID=A0A8B9HUG1_ASTMX